MCLRPPLLHRLLLPLLIFLGSYINAPSSNCHSFDLTLIKFAFLVLAMLQKNPNDKSDKSSPQGSIEHENLVQANLHLEDDRDATYEEAAQVRAENQRLAALERQRALEVQRMERELAREMAEQERASRSTTSNTSTSSSSKNSRSTGTK